MKVIPVLAILIVAVVLTGCPERRVGTRLIYVPAPPAATPPAGPSPGEVVVVQPPAPVVPAKPAPEQQEAVNSTPTPRPSRRRHAARDATPDAATRGEPEDTPGTEEPPPASPPQLAPASSAQQQVELEKRVGELKGDIQHRIQRLTHERLTSADRKALQDARLFLSQADQAMRQGDLQQSLNLAQKADLLIGAVEKRY